MSELMFPWNEIDKLKIKLEILEKELKENQYYVRHQDKSFKEWKVSMINPAFKNKVMDLMIEIHELRQKIKKL